MWGNADPHNINHWLPLATSGWPPSADLQWDEARGTCRNIAKGLQVCAESLHESQVCVFVCVWKGGGMEGMA
jgi:hypothetical protein